MKEIVKSKSGMILKLFIYQIAMSLFGMFVISPFNHAFFVYASIFASLFYFSLVCYAVIEDGQRDHISHSAGRLNGRGYTGLVYGLISYIPTILIVVLNCVFRLLHIASGFTDVLEALFIRVFLMGMYLGFDTGLAPRQYDASAQEMIKLSDNKFMYFLSDHGLIFAICLVIFPIVCGLTYYLAFKGILHVDTTPKKEKVKKSKKEKEEE